MSRIYIILVFFFSLSLQAAAPQKFNPTDFESCNAFFTSDPAHQKIEGKLEAFFETGTEGIIWSLVENGNFENPYDALVPLEEGDLLFVKNKDGSIYWSGQVQLDPGVKQALGYWVHGSQKDLDPEFWARMFFEEREAVIFSGRQREIQRKKNP